MARLAIGNYFIEGGSGSVRRDTHFAPERSEFQRNRHLIGYRANKHKLIGR
jgi:hypothetical protein